MQHRFFSFFSILLFSFTTVQAQTPIQLSGEFTSCAPTDTFRIWTFVGTNLQQLAATPLQPNGDKMYFNVNINGLQKGFYFVGFAPNNMIPLILGTESPIHLSAGCNGFSNNLVINGSLLNKNWNELQNRINRLNGEANNYVQYYRMMPEEAVDASIKQKLAQADGERMRVYDSLKVADPYLAKLLGLRIYPAYQINKKQDEKEEEYFARMYFGLVDLKDKDYNQVHLLVEQAQNYANTLTMVGLSSEEQVEYCEKLLEGVDRSSNTYVAMVSGFCMGFMGKNDDSFHHFATIYMRDYGNINPQMNQQFQQHIAKVKKLLNGEPAPDFALMTPEGKEVSLSSLRGKVVMIDFWASWCRPCRKENPNVVRIYNRFKDKGFEILGVSLDQSKDAWIGAIQQDNLTWKHVSDLAGWGSAAGKLYGVTGIPFTVIIDKDGKILEKNLRGEKLEKKLEKILMKP